MSETLLIAEGLETELRAAGVTSAQALIELGLARDQTSARGPLALAVAGTTGRFFFKGYRYSGWRKARGLLGRGTVFGVAPELQEFRALAWLRAHDIPAVRPIAAAARIRGGRLAAQALLTELVADAADVAARLAAPEDPLTASRELRYALAGALGAALARMHLHGFVHRDCHARNVLMRIEDDVPRIWFLDCRRGGVRRAARARHGALHDLACLRLDLRSEAGAVFGAPEWTHLLMTYLGSEAGTAELDSRIQRVAAKEARRQARRAARRAKR